MNIKIAIATGVALLSFNFPVIAEAEDTIKCTDQSYQMKCVKFKLLPKYLRIPAIEVMTKYGLGTVAGVIGEVYGRDAGGGHTYEGGSAAIALYSASGVIDRGYKKSIGKFPPTPMFLTKGSKMAVSEWVNLYDLIVGHAGEDIFEDYYKYSYVSRTLEECGLETDTDISRPITNAERNYSRYRDSISQDLVIPAHDIKTALIGISRNWNFIQRYRDTLRCAMRAEYLLRDVNVPHLFNMYEQLVFDNANNAIKAKQKEIDGLEISNKQNMDVLDDTLADLEAAESDLKKQQANINSRINTTKSKIRKVSRESKSEAKQRLIAESMIVGMASACGYDSGSTSNRITREANQTGLSGNEETQILIAAMSAAEAQINGASGYSCSDVKSGLQNIL